MSMETTGDVLRLEKVTRDFKSGTTVAHVLKGIDLSIGRHDFAALIGPSGSGKSTLLNILGLLDRPTGGSLRVNGREASSLSEAERTALRGRTLGFIFQFHHLLPAFTALENVLMPLRIARSLSAEDYEWGKHLLDSVGLSERMYRKATELSGGQAQRVAIARALASRPSLVLADEPTGNLDTESGTQAFEVMQKAHREHGCAFVIVTHDPRIADRCDRIIEMLDGLIRSDTRRGG